MTELETNRMAEAAVRISAHHIGKLPLFERAGWAVYLLELLDDGQDGYEQTLADVVKNIETRLAEGEW